MKERIEYIDVAKGISIFLVALYHSNLWQHFSEILEPLSLIRIPLFFLLSGIFFSWQILPKVFFIKKTESLLKPYFFVLFFHGCIIALFGKEEFGSVLPGIFYGNGATIQWSPLWFLTHLFAVHVFTYILFRYCKFYLLSIHAKLALLLFFLLLESLYIDLFYNIRIPFHQNIYFLPGLPFSIDIILITSFYFICGNLIKDTLIKFKPELLLLLLSMLLFFFVSVFTDAHINFNRRIFHAPLFTTIGSFCGIYLVISIAWFISQSEKLKLIPLHLGKSSLYILIFHLFIGQKIYYIFSAYISSEINFIILAIISFVCSIIFPIGIQWIILKSDILSLFFLTTCV